MRDYHIHSVLTPTTPGTESAEGLTKVISELDVSVVNNSVGPLEKLPYRVGQHREAYHFQINIQVTNPTDTLPKLNDLLLTNGSVLRFSITKSEGRIPAKTRPSYQQKSLEQTPIRKVDKEIPKISEKELNKQLDEVLEGDLGDIAK